MTWEYSPKRIPSHVYLDMEMLIDYDRCEDVEADDELATCYISQERFWHNMDELPGTSCPLLVRFANNPYNYETHAVLHYDCLKGTFSNEFCTFKPQHIEKWAYISDIEYD